MTVCLGSVVGLNFLVDFLLLLGTNRLCGHAPGVKKCALAALLGAAHSGVCLAGGFGFLANWYWRFVCLGLMGWLAFGWTRSGRKRTGIFAVLVLAALGMAESMGQGRIWMSVVAAGVVWLLCRGGFDRNSGDGEYVPVEVREGDRTIRLLALRDTGNGLRDPITGEQVTVVGTELAVKLTGLTPEQLRDPMTTILKAPIPGLRLIPYRAVGCTGGLLLGKRFSDVRIGPWHGSAILGFCGEGFGTGENYQALVGGAV
jgi:hypothetical protein